MDLIKQGGGRKRDADGFFRGPGHMVWYGLLKTWDIDGYPSRGVIGGEVGGGKLVWDRFSEIKRRTEGRGGGCGDGMVGDVVI